MFNVEITYKSGKVENTDIAISKYLAAMLTLSSEGRLSSMKILSVK